MVSAFVVHELAGRLRLRIPEKRNDSAFFAALAERLAECPGVTSVKLNAFTGSVLLLHAAETSAIDVARYAEQAALFSVKPLSATPVRTLGQHATKGLNAFDRSLTTASGGLVDLQSAFFLLLVGLAVYQARRGQILVPAVSMLWEAISLVGSDKIGKH
ncbi:MULTISPECIES: HMA2 domain-containing protein [unclassified Methylocaldum]|jgi:hypothetical protein|uniref:HMA2 domain-containing protein n=1 Tax=unclassified Methylocaldum TaxID=2622260 RepID=UPI000989F14C|nr:MULTISPECIES: hypothetical protein [unclassified Methylocaldum]MBP1151456.1 hypothetical protein [Methylocaldum sp. RMAD-M]MDV3241363.1 ABC transporter ATP-binding protein [Methylocaldum sp.]MVF24389.1 ABC transporter ATP-binding protein [Methylocaldum sp. BRCS4]